MKKIETTTSLLLRMTRRHDMHVEVQRKTGMLWFNCLYVILGLAVAALASSCGERAESENVDPIPKIRGGIRAVKFESTAGIAYTNHRVASVPWSIHVVRVDRSRSDLSIHSVHATGGALGLSPLSEQIKTLKPEQGTPLAGLNGDFYQRGRTYAGDPRGLQIIDGELISAPIGTASFWVDRAGEPHAAEVESRFKITWPDGTTTSFGLNEERGDLPAVLYTSALGSSTLTRGGRELVLERNGDSLWLPLAAGLTYTARVRQVRETGNTPIPPDKLVLSLNPRVLREMPQVEAGALLKISTDSTPDLRGAQTAISGGPVVVQDGKVLKPQQPRFDFSYSLRSMWERHPRSAIGWNEKYFYFLEVDGRHRGLSVGMTIKEIGEYMVKLGCREVMNLDGGGSATFWYDGRVRNSPCDRYERPIANGLVVVRRENDRTQVSEFPAANPKAHQP